MPRWSLTHGTGSLAGAALPGVARHRRSHRTGGRRVHRRGATRADRPVRPAAPQSRPSPACWRPAGSAARRRGTTWVSPSVPPRSRMALPRPTARRPGEGSPRQLPPALPLPCRNGHGERVAAPANNARTSQRPRLCEPPSGGHRCACGLSWWPERQLGQARLCRCPRRCRSADRPARAGADRGRQAAVYLRSLSGRRLGRRGVAVGDDARGCAKPAGGVAARCETARQIRA